MSYELPLVPNYVRKRMYDLRLELMDHWYKRGIVPIIPVERIRKELVEELYGSHPRELLEEHCTSFHDYLNDLMEVVYSEVGLDVISLQIPPKGEEGSYIILDKRLLGEDFEKYKEKLVSNLKESGRIESETDIWV